MRLPKALGLLETTFQEGKLLGDARPREILLSVAPKVVQTAIADVHVIEQDLPAAGATLLAIAFWHGYPPADGRGRIHLSHSFLPFPSPTSVHAQSASAVTEQTQSCSPRPGHASSELGRSTTQNASGHALTSSGATSLQLMSTSPSFPINSRSSGYLMPSVCTDPQRASITGHASASVPRRPLSLAVQESSTLTSMLHPGHSSDLNRARVIRSPPPA